MEFRGVFRFRIHIFLKAGHVISVWFPQFSLKTAGIYRATISDDRGKDMSQIDISGKGKHIFCTNFYFMESLE